MDPITRPLSLLVTALWLTVAVAALVGGYAGTALGLQALAPPPPPPGIAFLADRTVVTWGDPAAGLKTASLFMGLFVGALCGIAVAIAPLLVATGHGLSPWAWGRRLVVEVVRRPKGLLLAGLAVLGGPCIGLAQAWEQPHAATLYSDRVVVHTALQDIEGTTLEARAGDNRRQFWLRLDGSSLECAPTEAAEPLLEALLEALQRPAIDP